MDTQNLNMQESTWLDVPDYLLKPGEAGVIESTLQESGYLKAAKPPEFDSCRKKENLPMIEEIIRNLAAKTIERHYPTSMLRNTI